MKYILTESQLKRLIERGPNSPAYRGPEGYDDSCDCYVDEAKDYFTGSEFSDDEGNMFSVEKIYDFVKKNKKKFFKPKYPISKIKHNLEWWTKHYDIKNPEHKQRMMDADTSYPLLVVIEKNGNYSVADGLNRLYKAIKIEKKKTLPVYVVKKSEIEHFSEKKKVDEGLHDTSWENEKGDKITLIDLLNATEDIPVRRVPLEWIEPHLLSWEGDDEEVKKIERADLQYPILIFVNDDGKFISIIDGHHRAQKAVRHGMDSISGKIIPINSLPKNIRKVFSHL